MKTILVTGGAGFIGSNFIRYMLDKYDTYRIINLDALTYAGNLENLLEVEENENYRFIKGNVCDEKLIDRIFQNEDISYVINFAAESHVDRSILNPGVFIETNVLGTVNLLNAAKKYWCNDKGEFKSEKKYIQISTDEVYGSLGESGLFKEDTPLDPHSPYSASKASADLIVKSYYDTYGMPVNITRCSNNYGPYQFPEKLIPLAISNCFNEKKIPLYGDGLNVRDWLYVTDHCKAIEAVFLSGKLGETYNIGGNNEKKNIEILQEIIRYVSENINCNVDENLIKYVADRKGHDRRYAIDATKISKELGWEPEVCFENGVKQTIEWYKNNMSWIDGILEGRYLEDAKKINELYN